MILLDTKIISVALKTAGDENVLTRMDVQTVETLYLSTIANSLRLNAHHNSANKQRI